MFGLKRIDFVRGWLIGDCWWAEVADLGLQEFQEEAEKFFKLVKERDWDTAYLVTSANHMKRAEAVFHPPAYRWCRWA